MGEYSYTITDTGLAKIAAAAGGGESVDITQIAVGDGNGAYYTPLASQTALVNETKRVDINNRGIDSQDSNKLFFISKIAADDYGYAIRECGLFDAAGDLIAIRKYPLVDKTTQGNMIEVFLKEELIVTNTADFTLSVDPNVIISTQQYVADEINSHDTDPAAHYDVTQTTRGFMKPEDKVKLDNLVSSGYIQNLVANLDVDSDHDLKINRQSISHPAFVLMKNAVGDYKTVVFDNTAIIKAIDAAWAEGKTAGVGGLASGVSLVSGLTLYMFLLYNSSTGAFDAGFDDDITAANLIADTEIIAAGFDYCSVVPVHFPPPLDVNSNFIAHKSIEIEGGGLKVSFSAPIRDFISISVPPDVTTRPTLSSPLGVKALVDVFIGGAAGALSIMALDGDLDVPALSTTYKNIVCSSTGYTDGGNVQRYTNTNSQISLRCDSGGLSVYIIIFGYTVSRRP